MEEFTYRTSGTCSRMITFSLDDKNRIHDVEFIGGCMGNLKGISSLVEGMPAQDVIDRVEGTTCGPKHTSCPDQLAHALREALEKRA